MSSRVPQSLVDDIACGSCPASRVLAEFYERVMLPYQVGDVPLTCIAAVDYVSGIHVASSDYWLASFFARLFKMTNFAVKHSIMTPEMVENVCNSYYIPDEVHLVAPGRDKTITQFPEDCRTPRKVQAVEVQKKDDQVKLLESTSHCFMSLVTPAAGGSSSAAALRSKRKRLGEQSDTLPAKQLRKDHPSLATGTGGKTLAGLRQLMPTSPLVLRPSFQADIQAHVVQMYLNVYLLLIVLHDMGVTPTSDVAGSSQLETSEGSDDSFYELPALNSAEAKRWYEEEKAERAKKVERADTAEVVRLRGQVSALTGEVSALKSTIAQKDTDISLLDSRTTYLKFALDDSKAACTEVGSLITFLTSERDRLTSEVSTLYTAFQDFKEKAEAQQEKQAQ
ncbi:hypothetical protein Tco_0440141, partial [Tanacetum coccineum]